MTEEDETGSRIVGLIREPSVVLIDCHPSRAVQVSTSPSVDPDATAWPRPCGKAK